VKPEQKIITCLMENLRDYIGLYPAFRTRPVGAPGSYARNNQEAVILTEDSAREAIRKAEEYLAKRNNKK